MPTIDSIRTAAEWMARRFRPDLARDVAAVYLLDLTGEGGGPLILQVREGCFETREAHTEEFDACLRLGARDFFAILDGRANPDLLALEDRLVVEGDLALALKLRTLFRAPR